MGGDATGRPCGVGRQSRLGIPRREGVRGSSGASRCPSRRDASGTLDPMPYEVHTPVFEGPFDLLLHLILRRAGRPLRGVVGGHRRRVPGRAGDRRDAPALDLDDGHRVPAHRGHAGRAEGPPAAARARDDIELDEELLRLGGARPAAGAAPRVQDVQGRGRSIRRGHPPLRPEPAAPSPRRGAVPVARTRPARTDPPRPAAGGGVEAARRHARARGRHRAHRAGAGQRPRRGRDGVAVAARG